MASRLSSVGILGNSYIDPDAEMGLLPAGTDRRAWEVSASNAKATAKNLSDWLRSHDVNATVLMEMTGQGSLKLLVELKN